MKFLFFDQSAGVSGDMINAALFELHRDRLFLENTVEHLGLPAVTVTLGRDDASGLSAGRFEIIDKSSTHPHRRLAEIEKIINGSGLSLFVRTLAVKIFHILASAEASVHGTDENAVHFHETGAVDAICDIVCAAAQIEKLAPDKIYATPFTLETGGEITCAHGRLPVPVPAVLEIVKGLPVVTRDVHDEITTPTGAAIIRAIAAEYACPSSFIPEGIGYGAGSKKFDFPNLLRVIRGRIDSAGFQEGKIWQIETHVDDMNPQIIPDVIDNLLKRGASDAFCANVIMKKGRPGFLLTVLADEVHRDPCAEYLLAATSTIGLRILQADRRMLGREIVSKMTAVGEIRYKRVTLPGGSVREVPEFEDVKAAAERENVSVYSIFQKIPG